MTSPRWTHELATGNAEIDNDHQALVALVDQLKAAAMDGDRKAAVSHALDVFRDHAQDHFPAEERAMEAAGFPGLPKHREAHRHLADLVVDLIQRDNRGETVLYAEVDTLAQTLYRHILLEDKPFADFLRGR